LVALEECNGDGDETVGKKRNLESYSSEAIANHQESDVQKSDIYPLDTLIFQQGE
jgi:hypothetical protein